MATEKKETAQRDAQGVRKQSYKRFKEGRDYEPTDAETTAALCDVVGSEATPRYTGGCKAAECSGANKNGMFTA